MSQRTVRQWIRPEIRAQIPYHVPDATGMVKLDAMENPYGLPRHLVEDWLARLRSVPLNRYPESSPQAVKEGLRSILGLPAEQQLVLGNGSDELIQTIALGVMGQGRVMLAPAPSFVMYHTISVYTDMRYVEVPLKSTDFALDTQAMRSAIERYQPAVLFLAYPNNPTGNLWRRKEIEELVLSAPGLVVIDEAYAPFAKDSFIDRLGDYPNLLVMRTLSKMGLAGLRLGFLMGPSEWLSEFEKLRLPYNINSLTQVSVEFALAHQAVFDEQAARIRSARERLLNALSEMEGICAYPSEANFILFRTPKGRADEVFAAIKQQGVLIKNLSAQAMLDDCLRVTVGKPTENERFLTALADSL